MSDQPKTCTTNGAPLDPTLKPNGQQRNYVVLCAEEREKGFMRPVRDSYQHVGPPGPRFATRPLTSDEERYNEGSDPVDVYVAFEPWPEGFKPGSVGRFWTQAQLDAIGNGCGTVTTMGRALAETYARNPKFYGATFCCGCGKHLPVAEFVWAGTTERVGS